jgi:hypothetical protein
MVLGLGADDAAVDSPAPQRSIQSERSLPTAEADAGDVEDESLSYFSKLADEA